MSSQVSRVHVQDSLRGYLCVLTVLKLLAILPSAFAIGAGLYQAFEFRYILRVVTFVTSPTASCGLQQG